MHQQMQTMTNSTPDATQIQKMPTKTKATKTKSTHDAPTNATCDEFDVWRTKNEKRQTKQQQRIRRLVH
jgi:hypothetical protein